VKPLRNGKDTVVTGLDVGTTKICAVLGREEDGKVEIAAIGSAPSSGLRKGIVVDIDSTVSAIRQAVKDASDKVGYPIRSAYVGIAGGHIKGFSGTGAVAVKGGVVSEDDVDRLIDTAGAVYVPVEREVLHVIPSGFRLDGRNGIEDPVGMSGERLEANVHIVTGSVTSVRNLISCCEMAGVTVLDIVLEPLASAESALTVSEKKKGVVMVDIGGGTTDIALYRDGVLRHTSVLALGGNHLTNDIAVGLGISPREAETVKKTYGYALARMVGGKDSPDVVEVTGDDGRVKEIPLRYLAEIIQSRCEEFLGLVKEEMVQVSGNLGRTVVVLTGGTSLLRGIKDLAARLLGSPARIGIPGGVIDRGLVRSPIYSTGVGLVKYGLAHSSRQDLESEGIMDRMRKWVSGFFDK